MTGSDLLGGFASVAPVDVFGMQADGLARALGVADDRVVAAGDLEAPRLFADQLRHGAWGITVAVPHQLRVCRAFGVPRVFLANEVVDAAALRWIGAELDADPGFELVVYADSVRGVELMGPGRAGLFNNLVPVFGALFAVLILHEPFEVYHAIALALGLGGVAIGELRSKRLGVGGPAKG